MTAITLPTLPSHRARLPRRLAGLLAALVALPTVLLAVAGPAQAADGYRYWNYFHVQKGTYAFAQTGPGDFRPKDGSVEAYRYGLSSSAKGLTPRTAATTYSFADLCKGTHAASGQKRVGVLIDYGTASDADGGATPPKPRGDCAVVATSATGQQVLDKVADLRAEKGLVCGIDGYPVKGCSVTVKNPPAPATGQNVDFALPTQATTKAASSSSSSSSDDGGVPWTLVGVVVVVVVVAGGGLLLARRNTSA
jgi:hypothetical protein